MDVARLGDLLVSDDHGLNSVDASPTVQVDSLLLQNDVMNVSTGWLVT